MSGGQPGLTPPPEVPGEFADAYREAYERALLDQTNAARHRRPPQYRPGYVDPTAHLDPSAPVSPPVEPFETVASRPSQEPPVENHPSPDIDLPERRGRLVIGTHRDDDPGESWFDRARDSPWFVPGLLFFLAMVLVMGAYVLGRLFTATIGSG